MTVHLKAKVPDLLTSVLLCKVGWSCNNKFHTVPVERACTQKQHHVSMRFTPYVARL